MFRSLTAAAALAAALVACRSAEPETAGQVIDDTGRPVALERPARRIVSLAPGLTELLFAIGAGDRVVGRTRWGDYPPEVVHIPSVGDGLDPNVEMIAARRPDLVAFYASPSNATAIEQLEQLGISTVSLRTDGLADLARAARLLGRLTGDSAAADSMATWLEREVGMLESTRPGGVIPAVLILAWDNPPIVIGGASFLSEIVELAGGHNAFADVDLASLPVSIEAIVQRNPDIVLITSDSGVPSWANRSEWRAVAAVRARRFVVAPGSEFGRPSFRAPDAVGRLRAALAEWKR